MDREKFNNARRLAYAMYCTTGDAAAMQKLAAVLRYDLKQLRQDIDDLEQLTGEITIEDNEIEGDDKFGEQSYNPDETPGHWEQDGWHV